MSDLRLKLDTIDFKDLAELGRSLIPTVAPGWTDHNAHDPGIMLMELAAWIADAQVYALSRSSRAERAAYGRLVGLELAGPRPARGLVWPNIADGPIGTPAPWGVGTVASRATRATADRPQLPAFFTTRDIELTTAALTRVVTRAADGSTRDWTRSNSQEGATFLPFGPAGDGSGQEGRLELELKGVLAGSPPTNAAISVGFEIVQGVVSHQPTEDAGDPQNGTKTRVPVDLRLSLTQDKTPWPVSILEDTTAGLARSGVLLLNVDPGLAGVEGTFTLTIESGNGFLLPPRVQRIALNVLPVEQVELVGEPGGASRGTGMPDQDYTLKRSGLIYPHPPEAFNVFVGYGKSLQLWTRTDDPGREAPDATVYTVDEATGVVTFGNGINGLPPPPDAELRFEYRVSAGAKGNLPRGIQWSVAGLPAPFGVNSEVMAGGDDARDLARLRALARRKVHSARPIVTTADLDAAARAYDDLYVRRTLEVVSGAKPLRPSGARVLVAVGPHDSAADTFQESTLWLGEIRRRLAPRLPLGQSLDVVAPRLVEVHVVADLVAVPQLDPDDVRADVETMLRAKLAITAADGAPVWPFGRDITALTVKGWLRRVPGVARVDRVTLRTAASPDGSDRVMLGVTGLPRLVVDAGDITIVPAPIGGRA